MMRSGAEISKMKKAVAEKENQLGEEYHQYFENLFKDAEPLKEVKENHK